MDQLPYLIEIIKVYSRDAIMRNSLQCNLILLLQNELVLRCDVFCLTDRHALQFVDSCGLLGQLLFDCSLTLRQVVDSLEVVVRKD